MMDYTEEKLRALILAYAIADAEDAGPAGAWADARAFLTGLAAIPWTLEDGGEDGPILSAPLEERYMRALRGWVEGEEGAVATGVAALPLWYAAAAACDDIASAVGALPSHIEEARGAIDVALGRLGWDTGATLEEIATLPFAYSPISHLTPLLQAEGLLRTALSSAIPEAVEDLPWAIAGGQLKALRIEKGLAVYGYRPQWLLALLKPPQRAQLADIRQYETASRTLGPARHAISSGTGSGLRRATKAERDDIAAGLDLGRFEGLRPDLGGLLMPRYTVASTSKKGTLQLGFYDEAEGHDTPILSANSALGGYAGKALLPLAAVTLKAQGGWVEGTYGQLASLIKISNPKGRRLLDAAGDALQRLDALRIVARAADGTTVHGGLLDVVFIRSAGTKAADTRFRIRTGGLLETLRASPATDLAATGRGEMLVDMRAWCALDARADPARRLYLWLASEWNRLRQRPHEERPACTLTAEEIGLRAGIQGAGKGGDIRNFMKGVGSALRALEAAAAVQVSPSFDPKSAKAHTKYTLTVPLTLNEHYRLRREGKAWVDDGTNPRLLDS